MVIQIIELFKTKKMIKKIKQTNLSIDKTAVFNTVRPFPLVMHEELYLSYLLASNGVKVICLYDDGSLKHWDSSKHHARNNGLSICLRKSIKKLYYSLLKKVFRQVYKHKNICILNYSSILKKYNFEVNLTIYDKQQAESSVRRFFEEGTVNLKDKMHREYYQTSLENCKISRKIGQYIIEEINPNLFVTSHGIYSTWGSCYKSVKDAKIPCLVYGEHAYINKRIIITDVIAQVLSDDSDWKKFQKNHLRKDDVQKVIDCFDSRIKHQAFDTKIYYRAIKTFNYKNIQKNEGEYVFGLFPNVIWDGDVFERNSIFDGIIEWIGETLKAFENVAHHIVIRFHPAEATLWKESKKLEAILKRFFPHMSNMPNVHVISSNEKIDTYKFIVKNVDIGLIYDGILSMELTYLGKPVLLCSKNRYSGTGFAYEPRNLEEYVSILSNPSRVIKNFDKNKEQILLQLYKYAYWYFFKAGYEMPIFDPDIPMKINYKKLSCSEIDPSINPRVKRTLEKFLQSMK